MDPVDLRNLEGEDTLMMKTIVGATTGLTTGTIWGIVADAGYNAPRVESSAALPELIRTVKLIGTHSLTFAVIGGIYCGVEHLVQKYNMKIDFDNRLAVPFVAGGIFLRLRGRNITAWSAIKAGSALGSGVAITSAFLNDGGQTTKVDVDRREYYPYTVEKRPPTS